MMAYTHASFWIVLDRIACSSVTELNCFDENIIAAGTILYNAEN
jgi:hypothetical protein